MFKFCTLKFQNLNSSLNFTLKIWILNLKIWKYTLVPKIKSQVMSILYRTCTVAKLSQFKKKKKVFYTGLAQLHCNLLVVLFKWSWLAQNSISLAIKKQKKVFQLLSYVLPRKAIKTFSLPLLVATWFVLLSSCKANPKAEAEALLSWKKSHPADQSILNSWVE